MMTWVFSSWCQEAFLHSVKHNLYNLHPHYPVQSLAVPYTYQLALTLAGFTLICVNECDLYQSNCLSSGTLPQ